MKEVQPDMDTITHDWPKLISYVVFRQVAHADRLHKELSENVLEEFKVRVMRMI